MKISDKEYLEQVLRMAKAELREVRTQERIAEVEFAAKKEMLQKQIDSIEKQLEVKN